LWTHRTNVVPVVEEVGEAVEVGKGLVGRGEQGERPFPSQAAAQAGSRHRANQGAEPATGVEIRIRMFLGLPDPDPLVRSTDPDPAPDPSLFS
jgi:hypothetical protein